MKHVRMCFVVVLVTTLANAAAVQSAESDELWRKALELTGKNLARKPGRMVEREEIRTPSGELKRQTTSTFNLTYQDDGTPQPELVKAVRGSKEITQERRNELQRARRKGKLVEDEHNIFHPAWYKKNKVRRTDMIESIDGHPCVAFEYTVKTGDSRWDGIVFLDEETGVPRKLISTPDRLPGQADIDAWDVALTFHYRFVEPDDWTLHRLDIQARFKTRVAFWIPFEGRIQTVLTFSDYPEAAR